MRRAPFALLLLLLSALLLAACGDDEDEGTTSAAAPAASSAPVTSAAATTAEPPTSEPSSAEASTETPPTDAAPRSDEASNTEATESAEPPPAEKVTIALDWTANVNYLGIYAAIANGSFEEQGIEPEILPYAGTPAEQLIQAGTADLAISFPPDIIINRARGGLEYRAVAALVAHNTTALAVREDSEYTSPGQLSGKLYGGFGIQSDEPLITAIMQADGVAEPKFEEVVLNTGVIDALAKDRVQYTAVFAGIDDVTAELQGTKLRVFPYREFLGAAGDYPNAVYVASDETIEQRGDALKRALAALAEGYEWSAANPDEAGAILIEQNQSELSKAQEIVTKTAEATAPMFLADDGSWGALQDEDFAGLTQILVDGGIVEGTPPAPSDLYTNDLLPGGTP